VYNKGDPEEPEDFGTLHMLAFGDRHLRLIGNERNFAAQPISQADQKIARSDMSHEPNRHDTLSLGFWNK
jgi:hypothetical protein